MNRITTTITLVATALLLVPRAYSAEGGTSPALTDRIAELEARVEMLERELLDEGTTGAYSYQEHATYEATRGSQETPEKNSETYVIQDGDTLGSIARKHGVERADLLEANRLSEGQPIYIGETLLIPGSGKEIEKTDTTTVAATTPPTKVEKPTPPPANQSTKIVGDTKKEAAPKTHTVVKGDTLMAISRRYGVGVPAIKSANGLKTDTISLGQKLKIPAAGQQVAKKETKTPSQEAAYQYDNPLLRNDETYGYYTVRKGDNLYALARDFFSSMAELQRLNRLGGSTLIYPGDELIVPTSKYNSYHNGDVAQR